MVAFTLGTGLQLPFTPLFDVVAKLIIPPVQIGAICVKVGLVLAWYVMVMSSVSVQPFAAATVTVYVPAVDTCNWAAVPTMLDPFDHEYDTPPLAVRAILVVLQSKVVVLPAFAIAAVGATMFCVTMMTSVSVQPLAAVAVTV